MAMIECPKCGEKVSDKAFFCPNCKEELTPNNSNRNTVSDKPKEGKEIKTDTPVIHFEANAPEDTTQQNIISTDEQIENTPKLIKENKPADQTDINAYIESGPESKSISSKPDVQLVEVYAPPIKKQKKITVKKLIFSVVTIIVLTGVVIGGISIKHYIDDKKVANAVIDKINNIGDVTDASNEIANKIYDASLAYNALSDKQKNYVTNADTLTLANHQYEQKHATTVLTGLAFFIKKNAGLCQAVFSDYANVWHNAIFRKTDKYNNGNFSDFNNALFAFQLSSTYTTAQSTLKTYNTTITELWKETANVPSENQALYNAVKAVYTTYQPMYTLATSPEGSYNTYTAETQRLNSAYKTAYAELVAVLPDVESY